MIGSKYDKLRDYLLAQSFNEAVLRFTEIEAILGFKLPISAARPGCWSNSDDNGQHPQRRSWNVAGYNAYLQPNRRSVKFQKIR